MKAITVSDFRSNLKAHLDEVSHNSEIIIIPRSNNEDEAVVVLSLAEYNNMRENEYINSSKKNVERLRKSLQQAQDGKSRKVELHNI